MTTFKCNFHLRKEKVCFVLYLIFFKLVSKITVNIRN